MGKKDTFDVFCSAAGVAADAIAVFLGFMLAEWVRFESGWIPLFYEAPANRMFYMYGAFLATPIVLFVYQSLGLYVRPQLGTFGEKIPRLVRANGISLLMVVAMAFIVRTEPPYSRLVLALSPVTITLLVLIERAILFHAERKYAARQTSSMRILILGVDEVAARIQRAIENEPRLRSRIVGFLNVTDREPDASIAPESIRGGADALPGFIERREIDQVILTDSRLGHERLVEWILLCEHALVHFNLVPDLFRLLTSGVDVRTVAGIPILGIGKWPLDVFWNRVWKRAEDIAGSVLGLLISAPVVAVCAVLIKRESPGSVFYKQVRCGERGREFTLYKLRTMREDAEDESGPVWTVPDDPRRTRIGAFLRKWNIDELPQFWNVLRGDMSLVGPRPERPHFVEQFKEDIGRYMWRHVSKPGMTGWAQVNGLRGHTDLQSRIKYDLYYLENWSLAFDFKILSLTLIHRENAY